MATTVLNIAALALSAVIIWRFLRTGGPDMLDDEPTGCPQSSHDGMT